MDISYIIDELEVSVTIKKEGLIATLEIPTEELTPPTAKNIEHWIADNEPELEFLEPRHYSCGHDETLN